MDAPRAAIPAAYSFVGHMKKWSPTAWLTWYWFWKPSLTFSQLVYCVEWKKKENWIYLQHLQHKNLVYFRWCCIFWGQLLFFFYSKCHFWISSSHNRDFTWNIILSRSGSRYREKIVFIISRNLARGRDVGASFSK